MPQSKQSCGYPSGSRVAVSPIKNTDQKTAKTRQNTEGPIVIFQNVFWEIGLNTLKHKDAAKGKSEEEKPFFNWQIEDKRCVIFWIKTPHLIVGFYNIPNPKNDGYNEQSWY